MGSAIAPVTNIVGGILGQGAAAGDQGHAQALIDQAQAAYGNVVLPTDLANKIYYQQYQNAGQLTPAQEQIINAAPSIAGQTTGNKDLQSAQMQALNSLKNISQTGMSSTDRARLNQIQQQAANQAEGQKQAIMQNFAQRGQGGSGNELLAQLQAAQNATNQANQAGLGVAANAQQNALQALGQYGNQAGQMEGQQFGQQFQAGSAADQLNRFNTQNQLAQQARNVAGQNAAQQYNLQNQQNLMNANTGQTNQEMLRDTNAQQQLFSDAIQKAGGQAGADMNAAGAYNQLGNQKANAWTQGAQGVGQLVGGMNFGGSSGGQSLDSSNANSNQLMNQAYGYAQGGEIPYSKGGVTPEMCYGGGAQTYDHGGSIMPYGGQVDPMNHGGMTPMIAALMRHGGHVPGHPQVPGDSLQNDKVHALLSPGEIVIPRSITTHPDAPNLAKDFVSLELRKKHQR